MAQLQENMKQLQEEQPLFNLTLIEFLQSEYDIDFNQFKDELPEDDSGIDVKLIWNTVRNAISEEKGFEVVEELVLASFSFAKYLMWKTQQTPKEIEAETDSTLIHIYIHG